MAPKRKGTASQAKQPAKKGKSDASAAVEKLLENGASYCEELGIDMDKGGDAPFQWLCCSVIFSIGIAEQSTFRAAKGLITSGLTTPKSVKEAEMRDLIDAVNSQGNVQRGPSMSGRIECAADMVLDNYDGNLEKLREAASKDPEKEMKLIKEFKGVGDTAVNIFCREVQLLWDELFPFADKKTLDTLSHHGISCSSAQEVADLVDNDRAKYVRLLAQATKEDLRGGKKEGGSNKNTPTSKAPQKSSSNAKDENDKGTDKEATEAGKEAAAALEKQTRDKEEKGDPEEADAADDANKPKGDMAEVADASYEADKEEKEAGEEEQ